MTALLVSLLLAASDDVSLTDRPTRVQLLEEQVRLTAEMPSLAGGVVRLVVGGGLSLGGSVALAYGIAVTFGPSSYSIATLIGAVGAVALIVGVVVAIIGIVHTVRTLAARADRAARLEEIERALRQYDPPAPTPITVLTF